MGELRVDRTALGKVRQHANQLHGVVFATGAVRPLDRCALGGITFALNAACRGNVDFSLCDGERRHQLHDRVKMAQLLVDLRAQQGNHHCTVGHLAAGNLQQRVDGLVRTAVAVVRRGGDMSQGYLGHQLPRRRQGRRQGVEQCLQRRWEQNVFQNVVRTGATLGEGVFHNHAEVCELLQGLHAWRA